MDGPSAHHIGELITQSVQANDGQDRIGVALDHGYDRWRTEEIRCDEITDVEHVALVVLSRVWRAVKGSQG